MAATGQGEGSRGEEDGDDDDDDGGDACDRRLPNIINISVTGISGSSLLAAVPDVAASTGSACHAGTTEPSPILSAMGLDRDRALAAVRLSLGRWSTADEIDRAAQLLIAAARRMHPAAAHTRSG